MKIHGVSRKTLYFSDCKMHFYPPKFGRKMGVHHIVQMQLAWLTAGSGVGGRMAVEQSFFSIFLL